MGEESGERGSGKSPDGYCCYFVSFGGLLTVGTGNSLKSRAEPTRQILKSLKYPQVRVPPEDAFVFLSYGMI